MGFGDSLADVRVQRTQGGAMHMSPILVAALGAIFMLAWGAQRLERAIVLPHPMGKIPAVVWLMMLAIGFSFALVPLEHVGAFAPTVHMLRGGGHELSVFGYMAEAGACFIMLLAGLESNLWRLAKAAKVGLWVALVGILCPQLVAGLYGYFVLDLGGAEAAYFGGVFTATSVGITQAVMENLAVTTAPFAQVIQAAAVVDDVGGIIDLTIVQALNDPSGNWVNAAWKIGFALTGAIGIPIAGHFVTPHVLKVLRTWDEDLQEYALYALLAGFVGLAMSFGIAGIIGAFFTGLALDETYFHPNGHADPAHKPVEHAVTRLSKFFSPFFFVGAVCAVDPTILMSVDVIAHAVALTVLMVVTKMLAGLVVREDKLIVGVGMVPRGEVGIIFAEMGLAGGILPPPIFAIAMAVVLFSTVIGSMLIGPVIARAKAQPARVPT